MYKKGEILTIINDVRWYSTDGEVYDYMVGEQFYFLKSCSYPEEYFTIGNTFDGNEFIINDIETSARKDLLTVKELRKAKLEKICKEEIK